MQDVCTLSLFFAKITCIWDHQSFFHLKMYKCNKNVSLWFGVDPFDEYYKIKESTTIECLKKLMKVV
jgi:hypothetical protein